MPRRARWVAPLLFGVSSAERLDQASNREPDLVGEDKPRALAMAAWIPLVLGVIDVTVPAAADAWFFIPNHLG